MYTKTQWVDNTTPIDKDNLNKIEQGIYDNSLVVDAVTNTINPTDTETYKTAELTEGQITDVIGVSDIIIKGDTEQDGTPTPSAPVDVNVVSGSNDVYIGTKNKLKIPNIINKNISGVTFLLNNDGSVSISGTSTAVIDLSLDLGYTINISGEYTFSLKTTGTIAPNSSQQWILRKDTTATSFNPSVLSNATTKSTQTLTQSINNIRIYTASGTTFNCTIYPMLEQSSTATTYEPHQGKELPLDLPVENLFDKNNVEKYTGFTNGSDYKVAYNTATKSIIIPCKENTTYTVSKINGGNYDRFNIASFTTKPTAGTTASKYVGDNSLTSLTITTGLNDTYIMVLYYHTSETVYSENDILDSIQIEQGSKANAYTPYGTDPIELCKIGNYQDYFYKSGSKWYLHKAIGEVVLDGSESGWSASPTNTSGYNRFANSIISSSVLSPSSNSETAKLLSNILTATSANSNYTRNDGIALNANGTLYIYYTDIASYTLEQFKTWLASNNITLYYALATATNTEITDTILISQLESIYNAPLYEQTNITQENNDLPMVLDITACKDNINGIKAFIRK